MAVATGRIGDLDPVRAGAALGRGLADRALVAVVPLSEGGPDLAVSLGALWDAEPDITLASSVPTPGSPAGPGVALGPEADRWVVHKPGSVLVGLRQPAAPAWAPNASTADVGEWVSAQVRPDDARVVLDLTGITAHDGGAGLLAIAGDALAGRDLVGIVADDELELPATGIGGGLARRAFAARLDIAEVLAADAALAGRARALGPGLEVVPGGGAAGGCGLAVLASGGRLVTGTQFCHSESGLERTLGVADVVLTGCTELSALDRGGPVVSAVARWAEAAQRPCVLVTGGAGLARRELRTLGIEAAHLLPEGVPVEAALEAVAARFAAGWVSGAPLPHVN